MSSRTRLSKLTDPQWLLCRLKKVGEDAIGWKKVLFYTSAPPRPGSCGSLIELDRSAPDCPYSREMRETRLRAGHRLFALVSDGKPVCFGWLSPDSKLRIDELGKSFDSSGLVRWIWDCITPAEERGKGHYTQMLEAFQTKFPGPALLGIFCVAQNVASKKGIERAGFQPWFSVTRSVFGTKLNVFDTLQKDPIGFR